MDFVAPRGAIRGFNGDEGGGDLDTYTAATLALAGVAGSERAPRPTSGANLFFSLFLSERSQLAF